ncbi:MAG: fasciclin domain-containing protein [Candidatus Pseudobacter hemicellulosilyticus]|uniref:Fasciclin domain-containing protein n=1 Tax=Candidatus Pseudobacter hemicellulosilyticus TaxID=3121375 RepID=A0AAJ6BG79_9BACT|nr:MAG: fasciclin domain-containing protein [Pseudobacter sp.]
MNTKNTCRLLLIVSLVLTMVACGHKDILPDPIGEPVPYTPDGARSWRTIMDEPKYSFFKAAWNRSPIETRIKNSNSAYQTLFIPTNDAFTAAGWTMEKINASSEAVLDSLLAFYVVPGLYKPVTLSTPTHRSIPLNTVLRRTTVPGYSTSQPYIYKLYIGVWKDSMMVNGVPNSKWEENEPAVDGHVYALSRMVTKPTQLMIEYIRSQPRFSMLAMAIDSGNARYTGIYNSNSSNYINFLTGGSVIQRGKATLFLPTNQAFSNSGYNTKDDISARIRQSWPIAYNYNEPGTNFYKRPRVGMDSVLMPHGFALSRNTSENILFGKDLLQYPETFSGFMTKIGQSGYEEHFILETSFANQNGMLMVRDWRSPAGDWQPIVESDIECLNGVIHVVDGWLMRK